MYLLPPEKLTWYVYAGELGLEDDDDDLPPDPNPNPRPRPILRNSMRSIGSDRRRVRSRVVNLGTRFASFASSASSASSIPNATRRDDTADDTADTDDKKMSRAIITSSAARDVRSDRDPPRRSRPGHPSIHRVPSIHRSVPVWCETFNNGTHTHTHVAAAAAATHRTDRDDGDRDGRRRRRRWRRR